VGLASRVVAISAGGFETCALTSSGTVKCWGFNHFGQLGNGSTIDSRTPVNVVGLPPGIRAISTAGAGSHTCAVTAVGSALCWGFNQFGELGSATPIGGQASIPVVSGPTTEIRTVSVGAWHTCALSTAAAARCWGGNGMLGNAQSPQSSTPVGVDGLGTGVRAIATGYTHTCAITDSSGVQCWGDNRRGELGNGTTRFSAWPVQVAGLEIGVNAITTGSEHTCALDNARTVLCWGDNHYGMLGDGTSIQRLVPVAVGGLPSGVLAVSAGGWHTCALLSDGRVSCWGHGNFGELGYGHKSNSAVPVDVHFPQDVPATNTSDPSLLDDTRDLSILPLLAGLAAGIVTLVARPPRKPSCFQVGRSRYIGEH
jgi:alpha-tubulin suppressor-like RCC1 family protein